MLLASVEGSIKTGKWLAFHPGEMLGLSFSPSTYILYQFWALVAEIGLAGNTLPSKPRGIANINSKLKVL